MPNYLVDTHTLLWYAEGSDNLSKKVKHLIDNPKKENRLFLSTVSLWELSIKISLGKLQLPTPFDTFIEQQTKLIGYELLSIRLTHLATSMRLPFHHRDPFDRLLIGQAITESLIFLSRDTKMNAYKEERLSLVW